MDSLVTSAVAVGGTLAGASLTYLFGWLTARRAEAVARREQLRRDRIAAYTSFAGAITDLRQAVITLWFTHQGDADPASAQTEADRRGATADHARFTVRLLTEDPAVLHLVDETFAPITAIAEAPDLAALKEHEARSQTALDTFIQAAGRHVR
ncbi:hypothetical protein [Actinophytocola sp. NPDC049390]|uniref:hypothetical protein n=1 Tax=Actinophytocola sp. NPDC049390 TaxID=3363894 RepID=UPI0037B69B64